MRRPRRRPAIMAVGCRFSCPALVISRWLAPEVAVSTTVCSSCAAVGLRREVALSRASPPGHVPYIRDEDCSLIVPTLYDPEAFATLFHADKVRAVTLIAAMSEPQRVRQALAYAAWLAYH